MKAEPFSTFPDHNIKSKREAAQKKLSFHYQRKVDPKILMLHIIRKQIMLINAHELIKNSKIVNS